MYKFNYDSEKDKKLKQERGLSFDEIIALIESDKLLDILEHPNKENYPGQKIYILDVEDYIWLVPFVKRGEEIYLKTAFPSRKYTKQYMEENYDKV
ncbi:MAG: toxin [Candidatus Midichloriaceae bacterium]|jgi:uncharacterized DUF497 family protein|nr:toxin [Candidatus Midichloriaceae bacterium]